MNRTAKFVLAALLAAVIAFSSAITVLPAEKKTYTAITNADALHASGEDLVNAKGKKVFLRGINLGGWLIQEDWFCPAANGQRGDYYTLETLIKRFGTEKAYALYNIYQDAWIQETDFKNIADMGFNCVRIPFWYRNFQSDDNGTWIEDSNGEPDLSRLEWAVDMCRKYGLYAILDLHGVNGCQGMQDHCGQKNNYHFFDRNAAGTRYRNQAIELWTIIARRFKGDPAIAMFDLLNEPMCDVPLISRNHAYINDFYKDCYKAIRAVDSTRTLCMIGTWEITKLPKPSSVGWTNVVYQYHEYDLTLTMYKNRTNAAKRAGYNVPIFAGEFHPTSKEDTKDPATLRDVIAMYDNNNISWALWTYKGYNSWAAWADWFAYGSVKDDLIVKPETDSYEEIIRKWSQMDTNSGNFYKGHLFDVAYEFLPNAVSSATPFNKPEDLPETPPVTLPQIPTPPAPKPPVSTAEDLTMPEDWELSGKYIVICADRITPDAFRNTVHGNFELSELSADNRYIATGTVIRTANNTYTVVIQMDCNSDGKVNSSDARMALRTAARLDSLNEAEAMAADADGNATVNSSDARAILRRCAKIA